MPETDIQPTEEDTKKYGIGKVFLMQIQSLLQNVNSCSVQGNYTQLRIYLDSIFTKCYGRVDKDEKEEYQKIIDSVDKRGNLYAKRLNRDEKSISGNMSKKTLSTGKIYATTLSDYEKFIIKILDRLGWLIPHEKKPKKPQ